MISRFCVVHIRSSEVSAAQRKLSLEQALLKAAHQHENMLQTKKQMKEAKLKEKQQELEARAETYKNDVQTIEDNRSRIHI